MQGNVSPELEVTFIVAIVCTAPNFIEHAKLGVVGVLKVGLHGSRIEVPAGCSEELSATRLRHQLHDAAADVSVRGFKTSRLDLNFLHERGGNACAERPVIPCPDTNAAEGRALDPPPCLDFDPPNPAAAP